MDPHRESALAMSRMSVAHFSRNDVSNEIASIAGDVEYEALVAT